MELKIFTDCSHHKNIGSWSVLLKTNKENDTIVVSGLCPNYIKTSAQGEAYAIFKGVELAKKLFPRHFEIKIFTDCIGLLNVLRPSARSQRHPVNRMIQKSILKKLSSGGYNYDIVYVRGHQLNSVSNEALCHNIVDEHARKIRRQNPVKQKNWRMKLDFFIPYIKFFPTHFFQVLEALNSGAITESKAMG